MLEALSPVSEQFAEENQKAEAFLEASDLPSAARILVDIVEKDPQNWRALNTMGIISWMRQAWADAYTLFTKALTIKPDYSDAVINLFDAALKMKKIKDAAPLFEKAATLNGGNEEAVIIRDAIREQGEEIYKSERGLMIGTWHPGIEEANKLLEDGKIFEAMGKYMEIADREGPSAETYCGLGIISFYQKRFEDAFTLFLESIKLNPARTDTFLNLLDAAKNCGKTEKAQKIFEIYRKELPSLGRISSDFE